MTKINEGYLNMTNIPTVKPAVADDWYLPEIADDEFNCGIDCNVAPMVGAQDGMALSTMEGGEEDTGLDYLLQMAGVDGAEATPAEVVATEVPEEEYTYQPVDDIFSLGFEDDFDNSLATPSFDGDYDEIDALYSEPEIPSENEVEVPYENEIDAFDGIMDAPVAEEEPMAEPIAEPVPEVPAEEPVIEEPVEEPLETTEETPIEAPAEEVAEETIEANPEDMVLEKQPEVNETEAQQIKDYLIHNKEVLFGPASTKIEAYKKSLDGKTVEELRVEAEEVSPNWKKYIGKYKVNESVETKKLNESEEALEPKYAQYKITDLETGAVKLFDSLEALNNFLKDDQGLVDEDEFLSTEEDFKNFEERNLGGVQLHIEPIWVEVEGNGDLTIKQNTETKEYAVFRNDEILDDTITNDIQSAEKVLEDESEILPAEYEAEEINDRIADLSEYGLIHTEDLIKLAKEVHVEPQELEDIALELGYKVEGILQEFDEDFDKLAGIESEEVAEPIEEPAEERLQGTKVEPTDIDLENDGVAEVHVFDIQWDCDGADPRDLALPTEVDLTVAHDGSLDIADEISDQLSDDFGFCHYGFNFKVKSLGPDWDESSEDDFEDSVEEEVPADKQILTEEGEEAPAEDSAEVSLDDGAEMEDADMESDMVEEGLESPIEVGKAVPASLKESEEKIEALNVDVEPEEVKVEETTEADLKHEIPENDMIKDNIETGEEIKVDTPVEVENGEIETKEFEVKETTEADLKHEIKDNEPIKDNIDTGEEVKVDEPVEAENADIEVEEKADKFVESYIYSVELEDKIVECKSEEDFKKVLTENVNSVKSVVII